MIIQGSEKSLNLAQQIQSRLIKMHKTLVTAESCTGGLLASILTHHAGSSQFYRGGVSAYNNDVKTKVLGVSPRTLSDHGAVSKETAIEMAERALKLLNGDYSISITGIAGPDGGSEDKPVGTIYIALASNSGSIVKRFNLGMDRLRNRSEISFLALRELLHYTESNTK